MRLKAAGAEVSFIQADIEKLPDQKSSDPFAGSDMFT
jgi:hypothetical protein